MNWPCRSGSTCPVAAGGLTAWERNWQVDVFAVPSIVDTAVVWDATLEVAVAHRADLGVVVHDDDETLIRLAMRSGFAITDEVSGTT